MGYSTPYPSDAREVLVIRDKRGEPIISPGGILKLVQIIALIAFAYWAHAGLSYLFDPPIRAAFEAVGIVEPRSPQPSHR